MNMCESLPEHNLFLRVFVCINRKVNNNNRYKSKCLEYIQLHVKSSRHSHREMNWLCRKTHEKCYRKHFLEIFVIFLESSETYADPCLNEIRA